MICLPAGRRERGVHMSTTCAGHKPENLAAGAVLTTLSFFCVALVGALGKAAGQLTSTAVVVLFQNLPARAPDVALPDRCRSCTALVPSVHRARVPLRVIGQARSVYLYNDCLHSVDRLGHLASVADVVRRPGDGVGHRWRVRRDSRQDRRKLARIDLI